MAGDDNQHSTHRSGSWFTSAAGWLIPLVASGPSLFIWAGLMTMPLLVYLAIMFLSLFNPSIDVTCCDRPYAVVALEVMLLGGPYVPDQVVSIVGVLLMVGSAVYLHLKRGGGLVTTGPYRLSRNPQYLGAVLFIINLTSRSYREVLGDVGWIGPLGTLLVWAGTLVAYVGLALAEEAHLAKRFGEAYGAYRSRTPFLVPFLVTKPRWLEIALSVVVPAFLLWALVLLNRTLYP